MQGNLGPQFRCIKGGRSTTEPADSFLYTAAIVERDCPDLLRNLGEQIVDHLEEARKGEDKVAHHYAEALRLLDQAKKNCDAIVGRPEISPVLFVDIEGGTLSIQDLAIDMIRCDDWPTLRDIAVRIVGPNPSFPPTACFSKAHYDGVGGALPGLENYKTIIIDSITMASRISFRWAEQQPEAFSDRTGKKDLRGAYGLHAREMITWLNHFQHAHGLNIIFVGVLEHVVDDFKVGTWQLQSEGQRVGRELPAIVDQIITYQTLDYGDGKPPTRGFVCINSNPWNYPAKDRSGRLNQVEPPDLGRLLKKFTAKGVPHE